MASIAKTAKPVARMTEREGTKTDLFTAFPLGKWLKMDANITYIGYQK